MEKVRTDTPQETTKISNLFLIPQIIFSLVLIISSEQFGFINQGDFSRTIGYISNDTGAIQEKWKLKSQLETPKILEIYNIYLFIIGGLTKIFTTTLPISITSIIQKIFFLLAIASLAKNLLTSRYGHLAAYIIISTICFLPHNSGVFKSYYPESFFIIGLTIIASGFLSQKPQKKTTLILVGATLCGLSKVQYFYIPGLVLFFYIFQKDNSIERKNYKNTIILLSLLQIICTIPLNKNHYTQLNRYHALYLGAYMAMNDKDLEKHKISKEKQNCIGVDAWGNKLSGPTGMDVTPNHKTCFGMDKITTFDLISTYYKSPNLLLALIRTTFESHFTTNYFHVYPELKYLSKFSSDLGPIPRANQKISDLRSNLTIHLLILSAIILSILIILRKLNTNDIYTIFLLKSIIITQIFISLLGEGIRDLSKHLLGAQYALDLLTAIYIVKITTMVLNKFQLSHWKSKQ